MPFWNDLGKHENYKAKFEQKMCIAKETPEASFDLMDCNLSEVPPGVFSMCRVFLKESLLLENNNLTSLRNGGSLMDLSRLLVLNLKDNRFSALPDEIGCLTNLQDLNLENNRLKKLPVTFGKLLNLRRLNLKGNKLVVFPPPICCLFNLEYLNICDNLKIKSLPKDLSNLMQLKCLELDHSCVTYPSADICSGGVVSIMQFLCSESGKEYVPVTSPVVVCKSDAEASGPGDGSSDLSEKRQKDLLLMEEALKLNYETQTSSVEANIRKQKLLEDIAQEQERMENEIILLQGRKEKEKQTLLEILNKVEDHSAQLIKHLMLLNDRSRNLDQMIATLEKDRIENDEIFIVKQEELEQLRKKEILEAMSEMLQREEKQRDYEMERNTITAKLQNEENECNMKLLSLFQDRELDHQIILNTLMEEEQFQKQAFEALQLQKDHQHAEIAHQIHLIEKELTSLTAAELKKKDLKLNTDVNTLAEHRTALAYLLTDLLSAKEKRETELRERLKQMELQRVNEMEDFWLIQYQKLLDRKPKSLIIAEGEIDPLVNQVLEDVGAQLFIPLFAAKHITLSDLISFSIDDIRKIGILDETMGQNVLEKAWEVYKLEEIGDSKKLWHSDSGEATPSPPPSAPPPPLDDDEDEQPHSSYEMSKPSAPPLSPEGEMQLWCQTECVICLDTQSSSVFLPCGHVCCCQTCSVSVELCPMCRATIVSKFTLMIS